MPKAPGAGTEYTAVQKFNKKFPAFLNWLTKYHSKALDVLGETLDDVGANPNLRHSAAKEVNNMYLKFHSQLKNAKASDFVKESDYEKAKRLKEKERKAGVTPLLKLEYDPEDEMNGTDY